jgi:hypothetical protein
MSTPFDGFEPIDMNQIPPISPELAKIFRKNFNPEAFTVNNANNNTADNQ